LNKDGLVIGLDVEFQYRVDTNYLKKIVLEFRDADKYEKVVRYERPKYLTYNWFEFKPTTTSETDQLRGHQQLTFSQAYQPLSLSRGYAKLS
jgi:hypothetical protein